MRTIYIVVSEDGSLDGWGTSSPADNSIEMTLPEDHPIFSGNLAYRYIDDQLVPKSEDEISPDPVFIPSDRERIDELENTILRLIMNGQGGDL